jgi:hypothetical protein
MNLGLPRNGKRVEAKVGTFIEQQFVQRRGDGRRTAGVGPQQPGRLGRRHRTARAGDYHQRQYTEPQRAGFRAL